MDGVDDEGQRLLVRASRISCSKCSRADVSGDGRCDSDGRSNVALEGDADVLNHGGGRVDDGTRCPGDALHDVIVGGVMAVHIEGHGCLKGEKNGLTRITIAGKGSKEIKM